MDFFANPFGNLLGTDGGFKKYMEENGGDFGVGSGAQADTLMAQNREMGLSESDSQQQIASSIASTGVGDVNVGGFDLAGLASDLFTASEEGKKRSSNPMSMATNLTPHQGAGVRMPQAPQPMAQPMQQQAMQQPQNTAMQAVTQGFGKVPRIQQILQTLGYGR